MALIKCPECGQTVLSVATQCPNCAHWLAPEPGEAVGPNDLMHCGNCGELMTRRAKQCPHCGRSQRGTVPLVTAAAVAVVLVGAGVWFVLGRGGNGPSATIVPAALAPQQPIAMPVRAPRDSSAPPATTRTPQPVTNPVRPGDSLDPAPQILASPVATVSRFAQNWANVRAERNLAGEIMAVLRPGQEVAVGNRRGGWWSVFLGDSLVGYVSSNLLDTIPPPPGLP